jgi:hypothetical protein
MDPNLAKRGTREGGISRSATTCGWQRDERNEEYVETEGSSGTGRHFLPPFTLVSDSPLYVDPALDVGTESAPAYGQRWTDGLYGRCPCEFRSGADGGRCDGDGCAAVVQG